MAELQKQILSEFIKFLFGAGLLSFTWIIGQRVIAYWDTRKKRQEFDISTSAQFQQIYGEAKQINRLWRIYVKKRDQNGYSEGLVKDLLQRAVVVESKMESIVVKLSTERLLSDREIESLGLVRQAFQELRENIDDDKELTFIGSKPGYTFFQFLVCEVACIISSGKHSSKITPARAKHNLREITKYGSNELKRKADEHEKHEKSIPFSGSETA
jgi:hypothetical protein